jgi:hypothetical protein
MKMTKNDTFTVKFFNDTVQWAGWKATPEYTDTLKVYDCPKSIKQKNRKKKKKKKKTMKMLAPITNTRERKIT